MNSAKYLERVFKMKIDKDVADIIDRETFFVDFKSKHIILMEGMKSTSLYFIISGIVRGYYIDEQGNDITKCFSSEDEFFSSEGLRTASVSSFNIECLEPCQCIQIPYELVYKIIKQDKKLNDIFIKYYLKEVEKLEDRVKNSNLMDAKERYINFCREYPYLHDRVELKYIASYIGIRSASLSRIRKLIGNNFDN